MSTSLEIARPGEGAVRANTGALGLDFTLRWVLGRVRRGDGRCWRRSRLSAATVAASVAAFAFPSRHGRPLGRRGYVDPDPAYSSLPYAEVTSVGDRAR